MNIKKIVLISLISILALLITTITVIKIKPIMHKTIQLDNIIFVRSK